MNFSGTRRDETPLNVTLADCRLWWAACRSFERNPAKISLHHVRKRQRAPHSHENLVKTILTEYSLFEHGSSCFRPATPYAARDVRIGTTWLVRKRRKQP